MSPPNDMFKSVIIIKKNNLVDLSKFYFTLHEPSSLHTQRSRELQIRNKAAVFIEESNQGTRK